MDPRRVLQSWLLSGALLIVCMVAVGGITRLTGSGLSITQWRPVTGVLPPLTDAAWEEQFALYRASPQFAQTNAHFELSDFKRIFFWEYVHRLLGRLIGLFFVVPLLVFWRKKWLDRWLARRVLVLVALGGFQGLLGWSMVKSGLVDVPAVSHYLLAAHLLTALFTGALTLWTALEVRAGRTDATPRPGTWTPLAKGALTVTGAIGVQVMFGAFVAGLRAGYIYPTFPTMLGEWMPDAVGATHPLWRDLLENPTTVQFIHRWLGFGVALAVAAWVVAAWRTPAARQAAGWLLGAVALQFTLGALTVVNFHNAPVAWGTVHQAGAVALLAAAVVALFTARQAPAAAPARAQKEAAPGDRPLSQDTRPA
ncbi:MAG: COX15/CtaA family protein [bacterium]